MDKFTSKAGKDVTRCEIRMFDDTCPMLSLMLYEIIVFLEGHESGFFAGGIKRQFIWLRVGLLRKMVFYVI